MKYSDFLRLYFTTDQLWYFTSFNVRDIFPCNCQETSAIQSKIYPSPSAYCNFFSFSIRRNVTFDGDDAKKYEKIAKEFGGNLNKFLFIMGAEGGGSPS